MIEQVFVRSALNYDRDAVSDETGFSCRDISRTVQASKEEADINTIVKRFGVTGMVNTPRLMPPLLDDFGVIMDYRDLMNIKVSADRAFMSQPADVRTRFGNDPAKFVDFCSNPENLDEMRKIGLALPEKEVIIDPPVRVEMVNPPVKEVK